MHIDSYKAYVGARMCEKNPSNNKKSQKDLLLIGGPDTLTTMKIKKSVA